MVATLLGLFGLVVTAVCADPREIDDAYDFVEVDSEQETKLKHMTYEIEHNIGGDGRIFAKRGSISVDLSKRSPFVKVVGSYEPSADEQSAFHEMIKQNGMYSIRTRTCPDCPYITASIPACLLAQVRFQVDFLLHLDQNGALLALEHRIPNQFNEMLCSTSHPIEEKVEFKTTARVIETQKGPRILNVNDAKMPAPAGMKAVKKPGEETPEEQQSFLRKYWYIILPVVLMSLFTTDPEQPAAQRQS